MFMVYYLPFSNNIHEDKEFLFGSLLILQGLE